jgi:glycosyltransferase involved in cell wall biosynthesis
MTSIKIKKICLVVSSLYTAEVFLLDQLKKLSALYEVTLVANTDKLNFLKDRGINVNVVSAPIERKIDLIRDLYSLLYVINFFKKNSFDLVHSITPKAGLIAMIAGFVAGVPLRIHTFTGQVWVTNSGIIRWILKTADKLTALMATHILADSFSQLEFLMQQKIVSRAKSSVLANGSISGVNIERFKPDVQFRSKIRKSLVIPEDTLVFLYMARLTRDKGALVMAEGFARFSLIDENFCHLLVVGPDEEMLRPAMKNICRNCINRVHFVDYTNVPEEYMAAADIFCVPSYREGFGTVFINAGAVGIPSIASRIYGSEEAVQENITGLLHEAGNIQELCDKMLLMSCNQSLRTELGQNAQIRARQDFSETVVTEALLRFYDSFTTFK